MPKLQYKSQYTKEELEQAVKQNISILGTMNALNAPLTSGTLRKKLTQLIWDFEIDTSHFLGMSWNNGKGINHIGGILKQIVSPDDERKCTKCGVTKLAKDFYRRKKEPRAGDYYEKCKDCMKVRGRTYFYQNHERQYHLARVRQQGYIEQGVMLVSSIKKDKPCQDCGKIYPPCAMDFDHREGEIKVNSISYLARRSSSIKVIKQEIEKCDLVCAVCHRVRTYNRLHRNAAVTNLVKVEV